MVLNENELLDKIAQLEIGEMDDVIHTVRERFKELHPDTEMVVVSIPKDNPKERVALYEWLIRCVQAYEKEIPL